MVAALREMLDEEADAPQVETLSGASSDGPDEASNALTEVASADDVASTSTASLLRTRSSMFSLIPDAAPASCTHRLQTDLFDTFMDCMAEGSIKVVQPAARKHVSLSAEEVSPYDGSPRNRKDEARMFMGHASLKSLGSPTARDAHETRSSRELVVKRVASLRSFIPDKIARLPHGVRSLPGKISRSFRSVRHDNGVASHDLPV
jgi:hypothetical protein